MITKEFEIERTSANVLAEDDVVQMTWMYNAVADISKAIQLWIKENKDHFLAQGGTHHFKIKMLVEITDGV